MRSIGVWPAVAVALLAVVAVAVLAPSSRRGRAERDVWVQFEQATGRRQ